MDDRATIEKEIRMLCHGLLENSLTERQTMRLDELVTTYPEARIIYIELMNLHNTLLRHRSCELQADKPFFQQGGEDEEFAAGSLSIVKSGELSIQEATDTTSDFQADEALDTTVIDIVAQALPTTMKGVLSSSSFIAGTITFSVGMFLVLFWVLVFSGTRETGPIARVTQSCEAVWSIDTAGSDLGQLLYGSRIELESGLAQIEYKNGVRVNLEGPAVFVISGSDQGRLLKGKLSALAKGAPTGFTVRTSIGNVVDLGTEFGVKISDDQDMEVQVFDGLVRLDVLGTRSNGHAVPAQSIELHEKEAVQVDSARRMIKPVSYVPDQFARTYQELKQYFFDDFSADTSQTYIGAYSIWGDEDAEHVVQDDSFVVELEGCAYSVFKEGVTLEPHEVFAVDVPETDGELDVVVMVSTIIGETQGGPDGGVGLRLQRNHAKEFFVQKNDSSLCFPVTVDLPPMGDPAPDKPIRLVIERCSETEFFFYYELNGVRVKLCGPISNPEFSGVKQLYVGFEVSNRSDQKRTVTFDNLSVRPMRE